MEATGKERRRGKAAVVGGSIAGLCCAHALISAGWDVAVIEKSTAPLTPSRSPTGAGLGLDPQSREILVRWISDPQLHQATFPLSIDLNRATDSGDKTSKTLTRDENFNFRAAHWADLHSMLYKGLSPGLILWGHQFISFQTSKDKSTVGVKCRVSETGEIVELEVDLLVAADGCLSAIRQNFLPNLKLRYAGYCAWRGVLDYSDKEDSDLILGMRKAYPELGNCLYFDLAHDTHAVLYELKNKRLNWIWYVNQPEPESKGSSVTMKVSKDALHNMHEEANKVWVPQLASVMQETTDPFINIIYDSDPLPRLHWLGKIVLVGDAAHPTTPHGLRSTNMSVVDAHVLGKCLERHELEDLEKALEEFQAIRLPVVSEQVLYARKLGRVKQGLDLIEDVRLDQRGMPYFDVISDSTMGTEVPRFYWGNKPEEAEFYASQGVKNRQAFHQTPYGRLFTQSFHPINRETGEELPIKGTVYLTHGYGSDSGWLFQSIAIAYANWGYAAYCADLLGHGRSDGLRCYMGDFEAVAGASLHFFLSVRKDPVYADLPAFLFGESMGGAATMVMYLRSPPDTWTGLIFSAPLFVMPEEMKPSKLRLFLFGLLFGMADTWQAMPDKKMVGKAIRDPEKLRIIASNPRRYTEPPRVGTMRELARICGYIQESFPKVTVPFLTVHGTEDGVTAPEGSKLLYEKAASKDKSLILYEGYYHSLLQGESEENSKRVLADLREWIDERTKRYGNGVSRVVNVDKGVSASEEDPVQ